MTPAVSPTSGGSGHHLRDYFLPRGMSDADLERLESLASNRRHVSSAQTLYREGAPFVFVYLVRSGTLKSSLAMADGGERVNGFYMAGELTGLDAVAYGRHASSATAITAVDRPSRMNRSKKPACRATGPTLAISA